MIRSMTGFGDATADLPEGHFRVTLKTVNHRFFNAHLKVPRGFDRYEGQIQQWLKSHFSRGHVSLTLTFEQEAGGGVETMPRLDLPRARHYRDLLTALKTELDLAGEVELTTLLRFSDVFQGGQAAAEEVEIDPSVLQGVVEEAAARAVEMRLKEGALLEEDMRERLRGMERGLSVIAARAPERLLSERDRLKAAVSELSENEDVDEDRLAKEIAYLSERWDINEEIVRFRAHLQAFEEALEEKSRSPVGKRLGFLVQEMHREANTIASKANDLVISQASIEIREEIERLREQLENVE